MYIRADITGNIKLVSNSEITGTTLYAGDVPVDFFQTVGLGKYQFLNNAIVPVSGWFAPPIKSLK